MYTAEQVTDLNQRYQTTHIKRGMELTCPMAFELVKDTALFPSGARVLLNKPRKVYLDVDAYFEGADLTRPEPRMCQSRNMLAYFHYIPEKQYKRTFYGRNLDWTILARVEGTDVIHEELYQYIFFAKDCGTLGIAVEKMRETHQSFMVIDSNFAIAASKVEDKLLLFFRTIRVATIDYNNRLVYCESLLHEEVHDLLNRDMAFNQQYRLVN